MQAAPAKFFTTINLFLLVLLIWIQNPFYKDIVKASTMICFAAVLSIWLSGKIKEVYHAIYEAFFPPIDEHVELFIMFCGDMLLHVIPFLILGFPSLLQSILIGYIILFTWYFMIRSQLHEIYSSNVNGDWSAIITSLFGSMVIVRNLNLKTC